MGCAPGFQPVETSSNLVLRSNTSGCVFAEKKHT